MSKILVSPPASSPSPLSLRHRVWLIGLSALDWPVVRVFKVWQALRKGEIIENDLRVVSQALQSKFSLTNWQVNSIQKFFTEYSFDSFFEWGRQRNYSVLTCFDAAYPADLQKLESAPPVLWYQGDWDTMIPAITIVGTRHPTPYGLAASQQLVTEFVERGWVIISGFMYGADIAAQQQALQAGGQTVGVVGFGLQQMYPASHRQLLPAYLEQGGVLVSPFAPWAGPKQWRFLERNRIVAGLGKALVVTEAAPKSGTHSTVTAALDLGRTVGVVPSPITSPFAAGASVLVNQGALLIHSAQQILEEVGEVGGGQPVAVGTTASFVSPHLNLPPETQLLAALLQAGPHTITSLTTELHQPVQHIAAQLSLLELDGWVLREGAWFRWATAKRG